MHPTIKKKTFGLAALAALMALGLLAPAAPAAAQAERNIDLSTVQQRDSVQLTIYNAEDLTLVRETRRVVFKQGVNPLQFSWAGTRIDPTSVELRFVEHADKLALLDTTYPHDKPQQLYWSVRADEPVEAAVEVTYFTSGISWSASYAAVLAEDARTARLEGFVTVNNRSGEDYEDAEVRLVVGTINLVQKIRELAEAGAFEWYRPGRDGDFEVGRVPAAQMREARRLAATSVMTTRDAVGFSGTVPKEVIKEGLSEYFIFTIEGTESIPDTLAKRLRSFDATEAPVELVYRYRPQQYGPRLVRVMKLTNDEAAGLGEAPLPDGEVRVYQGTADGGLRYLTAWRTPYIPIGDEMEANLGPDPRVVFEHVELRVFRDDIWLKIHGVDALQRADRPGLRVDPRGTVAGWTTHTVAEWRVLNTTGGMIELEVRQPFGGDATFRSRLGAKRYDAQTVELTETVAADEEAALRYELIQREGRSAEQRRLAIEAGDPAEVSWL